MYPVSSMYPVSFEKKLIPTRIGLFGDYEGSDFTIYLKYPAQHGVRFRPSGSQMPASSS